MMEVKQNAAVDLNLLTSSNNSVDEAEDAVMQDLEDRTSPDLVNCDILKSNGILKNMLCYDKSAVMEEVANGDAEMTSLIKDIDEEVGVDLNIPVNSELEDALLAEDDVLPEISRNKITEAAVSTADDILAEKSDSSNSTTSSSNARDPGDDLDTLLSKINDIVEDCIEKENENAVVSTMEVDEPLHKDKEEERQEEEKEEVEEKEEAEVEKAEVEEKEEVEEKQEAEVEEAEVEEKEEAEVEEAEVEEKENEEIEGEKDENKEEKVCEKEKEGKEAQGEKGLNEGVLMEEDMKNIIDSNLKEGINSDNLVNDDADKNLESSEETENLLDDDIDRSATPDLDFPLATTEVAYDVEEEEKNESDKTDTDENEALLADAETSKDLAEPETKCTDNVIENNLNMEKTEESKEEMVQDNKITSNSNEVVESAKTTQLSTLEGDEEQKESCNAEVETTETLIAKKSDKTLDKTQEILSNEESTITGNAENYDSDDEIVFYVDKPPEKEKQKKPEDKLLDAVDKAKGDILCTEKIPSQEDDDVVLLLDDEEEEENQIKKKSQSDKELSVQTSDEQSETNIISSSEGAETKEKDIVVDNSDNARDDFANDNTTEKDKSVNKTEVTETSEETNSNCSSSSNLLQESKSIKTSTDETTPDDAENEEEEDDGDVELIIGDLKESESEKAEESEIAPPAKRIRLSEEGEEDTKKQESCDASDAAELLNNIEKKRDSVDNSEQEKSSSATLPTLKRSHDVIELEVDEKSNDSNEGCNKKPKTDAFSDKVDITEDDKQSEDIQIINEDKKEIKAIPSYEPIRLYPAPKFAGLKSELPMSLEYLKKFRKSFDNMTKQDLEELVLQKVVEAIIHRSEFSEMRELIEKQEKLIGAHRTKISELSKQFRDLEMVHNRVVKDIEQRNSQFIMPVKITRAVGLQVYIPNKKSLSEATSSSIGTNIPTSPQRPISSQASSTSNTSITSPQRQFLSTQSEPQRSLGASSSVSANAVRRGCVQKITPIRPVPGSSQTTSSGPSAASSAPYRNTQNHASSTQPRILNKNANTNQNASTIQRSRYGVSNQDGQRMAPTQQISRAPNMTANSQRVVANSSTQSKPTSSVATTVPRRSDPIPSQSSNPSSSIVDNYLNTLTHLTGGNTAVSITPAKPKEKAVIDLTDEDEQPVQTTAAQPITQIPSSQVQRRSLPSSNNSNSQIQHGRPSPNMARVPPASQIANNKNRQMSSLQAQKSSSFTSISTPPGTSITRINVAQNNTNVQRVKYSHPAPLPATPPQAFNPSWKLPPPRPTIRISNLDNGIVISWTMEESMDRHAECVSYQIYAYQETSGPPMVDSWRHVGDVKAMLLPMAVTLTQFQEGQRYYFAVRAVDCHQRYGPFSLPKTWS